MPSFDRTKRALSATHSTTLQAASASSTSSSKSATSPASSPPSGGTPSGIGRDGAVAASGSGAITSVLKGFRLPAGSPSPCQPSSQSLSPGDGDVAPRCAEGAHIEDHIAPLLGVVVPIQHPRFPDIWCPQRGRSCPDSRAQPACAATRRPAAHTRWRPNHVPSAVSWLSSARHGGDCRK